MQARNQRSIAAPSGSDAAVILHEGPLDVLSVTNARIVDARQPNNYIFGTTIESASPAMGKNRLEMFTDGVIAIIITIMVLELKTPHGSEWSTLLPLLPIYLSYVLSFFFLSLYWIAHHHMLHAVDKINGLVMWANLNLLFWLSLIPFATGFMGENHFAAIPLAFYGSVMFLAGLSFYFLERTLIAANGDESMLAKAVGKDIRSLISPVLWLVGIGLSLFVGAAAVVVYILIALMWIIPNRRIEGMFSENRGSSKQPM